MIKTVSDLLEEIKKKGLEMIKENEIVGHPGLIGDMYEGLTQELLQKGIFEGLDLKIVTGKIKNGVGKLSDQIDCMLVEGVGEKLPFSEKYIYHFNQVIAVIEVKKSLYSNDLDDSFWNLKSVMDVSQQPERDGEPYLFRALRDAYRMFLRTELPDEKELKSYSNKEQYVYHTLLMEIYFPLRIVFGYFGFKTEYSLREGFANFLMKQVENGPKRGFGANSLPQLIICNNKSIIKLNGMPFGTPLKDEEFYWPIYMTDEGNPIHYLLELIWTRLSYRYHITSDIFGDDFDTETAHGFIDCKLTTQKDGSMGWEYRYLPFSAATLASFKKETIPWQPVFVNEKLFHVFIRLCHEEFIDLKDNDFHKFVTSDNTNFETFIYNLIQTGLVYRKNDKIALLTDLCTTAILPDGRFCVGENKNGQFSSWIAKFTKEKRDKK